MWTSPSQRNSGDLQEAVLSSALVVAKLQFQDYLGAAETAPKVWQAVKGELESEAKHIAWLFLAGCVASAAMSCLRQPRMRCDLSDKDLQAAADRFVAKLPASGDLLAHHIVNLSLSQAVRSPASPLRRTNSRRLRPTPSMAMISLPTFTRTRWPYPFPRYSRRTRMRLKRLSRPSPESPPKPTAGTWHGGATARGLRACSITRRSSRPTKISISPWRRFIRNSAVSGTNAVSRKWMAATGTSITERRPLPIFTRP